MSTEPRKNKSKQSSDVGSHKSEIAELRLLQKRNRKAITLFRAPLTTLYYFALVLRGLSSRLLTFLAQYRVWVLVVFTTCCVYALGVITAGPQQQFLAWTWSGILLMGWWVGLGVLSSVGLGTGLHTFVLYLGPFIASATLAATECKTTNFERYGPARFICSDIGTLTPSFFEIWQLVAVEAFLWGAGTALGELPPYFVARAARLASLRLKLRNQEESTDNSNSKVGTTSNGAVSIPIGTESDEDDSDDDASNGDDSLPNGVTDSSANRKRQSSWFRVLFVRARNWVVTYLGKIGFIGILLFASIPNPLFDLAGLTCGHMLVPFTTFFLATLIGKAVVKVTLQTLIIISVFDKQILEGIVQWIGAHLPFASARARAIFDGVRQQYHKQPGVGSEVIEESGKGIFALWDVMLGLMIGYFVISIMNSMVQEYLVGLDEEEVNRRRAELSDRKKIK